MPLDIAQPSQKDTTPRLLALSHGGRTNVQLIPKPYSFEQFAGMLTSPKIGEKDGSYYLRGGDLVQPKRADENLRSAWLVIVDGDHGFDPETGEVVGAPPLEAIAEQLRRLGLTFAIHTTHSARPEEGVWKYRAVIPAAISSADELAACLEWLFDRLHAAGVFLANVPENARWAQLWYLPRVASSDALKGYRSEVHYGEWLDVPAAVRWRERRDAQRARETALTAAKPASELASARDGHIARFNEQHGLDWIRGELEAQGYRFAYLDKRGMGGQGGYRYIRPGSTTGQPGVVVFRGSMGDWCVFSHHGGEDRLSGKTLDPFGLYALFHHGGDTRAAGRSLVPAEKSAADTIRERAADAPKPAAPAQPSASAAPEPGEPFHDQKLASGASYPQKIERVARKIELVAWGDLKDAPVRWLIKDVMPARSLAALYGKPGSYKSFVALYLAAMIAMGREAFGRSVEQGAVVYVAGEGGAGLKRRRDALIRQHGLPDDAPIYFLRAQLDLRSKPDDALALIAAIRALGVPVSLIIIDTLARAFAGGNENSSEDMGAFISIVGAVMDEVQCAALVVHHSGKDEARGMRGHSSLLGAVDAELEVVKLSPEQSEERIGQLTVTKQKDGDDGFKITYRLASVALSPIDADATSLAVVPVEEGEQPEGLQLNAQARKPARRRRANSEDGDNDMIVWQALEKALRDKPEYPVSNHIKRGQACVTKQFWKATLKTSNVEKNDEAVEQAYYRAVRRFKANGNIDVSGNYVWITRAYENY